MEKVNKANVNARIKELKAEQKASKTSDESGNRMAAEPEADYSAKDELKVLNRYIELLDKQTASNKKIKDAEADLDKKLYAKYPALTEAEIKQLVVDDKWMQSIEIAIQDEIDHISQRLTNRVKELAERYEETLAEIDTRLEEVETKVNAHLVKMGFV